jgi:hypothetical protein
MTDTRRHMLPFSGFEWDVRKRQQNIEQHGIDFEDAARLFDKPFLQVRSDRGNEERYVALGILDDIEIAVVYTVRSNACRIISARRARQNERKAYNKAFGGEAEKGQD